MFTYIKRFFFFFLTNIAVLALLSIIMMVVNFFFPGLISANWWMLSLLIYAAVIGFAGSFISLFLSKWSAKRAYNIVLLDDQSSRQDPKMELVWSTVSRIAQISNIKMPEVWYFESSDPNAFATGSSKNNSLVAVSTGLLDSMTKNEIEWVVWHEMAHVMNGDMVTLTLIQWVMNTFVIFLSTILARIVAWFLAKDNESVWIFTYNIIAIIFQIGLGFLASFVIMYVSRMREYRADLGWAHYTSKAKMIAWLRKLQGITAKIKESSHDPKMSAFMITEPDSFFSTHPSLDNRIKALEENYKIA